MHPEGGRRVLCKSVGLVKLMEGFLLFRDCICSTWVNDYGNLLLTVAESPS